MPDWIQRLVKPIALPGILRLVAGFQALVFLLMWVMGPAQAAEWIQALSLDARAVLGGELWRLVSFIAIPPVDPFGTLGFLWMLFAVIILFLINDIIEGHWGSDGLNALFYFGLVAALAAAFAGALLAPGAVPMLAFFVPSLFSAGFLFAAGALEPRYQIMLFLVIPVPLGLIAVLVGVILLIQVAQAPVLWLVLLISQAPVAAWLPGLAGGRVMRRRRPSRSAPADDGEAFHQCAQCGATEVSHPECEFRVNQDGDEICSECLDG